MLDPKLEDDLMEEISVDMGSVGWTLDTWVGRSVKAKISEVIIRAYQEGMRDAFLKMGSYLKT